MARARARQAPLTHAIDAQARVQIKRTHAPKHPKLELARLRESLKAQTRGTGKTKAILDQIEKRYGNAELKRAIREFNIAFHSLPRDPDQGKNPKHG